MTAELGQLIPELRDDFDWLRSKWREFRELYEGGQDRIDLLNTVASNFFYFLQKLLFEDAMLHLCRLSDPPQMRGHKTLTVRALADAVSDPALKISLVAKLKEVGENCEFARKWRNKRLAHTDLATLRDGYVRTLPAVDATNIDTALKSIGELLTLVEGHFGLPATVIAGDPWGARSLLSCLEKHEHH